MSDKTEIERIIKVLQAILDDGIIHKSYCDGSSNIGAEGKQVPYTIGVEGVIECLIDLGILESVSLSPQETSKLNVIYDYDCSIRTPQSVPKEQRIKEIQEEYESRIADAKYAYDMAISKVQADE